MEVLTGVAASGVATGLAVYVARSRRAERQRDFLHEAMKIGLGVGAPLCVAIGSIGVHYAAELSGGRLDSAIFALAAVCGWIGIVPVLVNSYWLARQERVLMLYLALASAALAIAASVLAPARYLLEAVVASQALPVLALAFVRGMDEARPRFRTASHPLRRYVIPGLAIGILGPIAMLLARGVVGDALSWHDAGVLQALLRLSDWVCAFAGGLLSIHYLPRFARAGGGPQLWREMEHAARAILIPSAAVFGALFAFRTPLLELLYEPGFAPGAAAVALFFAGSLLRVASWIPLFALYAMRRTGAIAIGEVLSLPLFALCVYLLRNSLTLELAGVLWTASYVAYGGFNLWFARRSARF